MTLKKRKKPFIMAFSPETPPFFRASYPINLVRSCGSRWKKERNDHCEFVSMKCGCEWLLNHWAVHRYYSDMACVVRKPIMKCFDCLLYYTAIGCYMQPSVVFCVPSRLSLQIYHLFGIRSIKTWLDLVVIWAVCSVIKQWRGNVAYPWQSKTPLIIRG
jgi:hypothetical protein